MNLSLSEEGREWNKAEGKSKSLVGLLSLEPFLFLYSTAGHE